MKIKPKDFLLVPNILTSTKLITIPLMMYYVFMDKKVLFLIFAMITWLIDFVDGTIAKLLKQQSYLGHLLDTYTDLLFVVCLAFAYYIMFEAFMSKMLVFIVVLIIFYSWNRLFSWIKFKRVISLHLWVAKAAANFLPVFIIHSIIKSPSAFLFYLVLSLYYLYVFEELLILRKLKKPREDIHSIFELK